jgi:putative lipoic acid-binding regulatory protein
MDREAALALLQSQHEFPGPFEFRVVVPPKKKELTVSAIVAAAGREARVVRLGERYSRTGKYVALQVKLHLASAEMVLEVYAVIRSLDYVLASL